MEMDATVAFMGSGARSCAPLFLACKRPGDTFARYRRLCFDATSSATAMDPDAQWSAIGSKSSLLCHIVSGSH